MWKIIDDCGKQLTVNSRVRAIDDQHTKIYEVIEIEFDQYKLQLISRDGMPAVDALHQILTCDQLVKYNFEVEENEATVID
ncbi:MAG: hypothetical protein JWP81_5358 [Ferruginibacter sp.]|nr:hypothetical protein [Ferruginibacter sp.]